MLGSLRAQLWSWIPGLRLTLQLTSGLTLDKSLTLCCLHLSIYSMRNKSDNAHKKLNIERMLNTSTLCRCIFIFHGTSRIGNTKSQPHVNSKVAEVQGWSFFRGHGCPSIMVPLQLSPRCWVSSPYWPASLKLLLTLGPVASPAGRNSLGPFSCRVHYQLTRSLEFQNSSCHAKV